MSGLSEERLGEIRGLHETAARFRHPDAGPIPVFNAMQDLLAEVDRLRAENERLRRLVFQTPEGDDESDPTGEKRYPEMRPC